MSSIITNEDLRSIKTEKALCDAMFSLLKKLNYRKITIKAICEEALISRATFYAHFIDKYDLLKYWLVDLFPEGLNIHASYDKVESLINEHINDNMQILKNLVYEADNETIDVLYDFIISTINLSSINNKNKETYPEMIVLSNFYAGGVISYLSWQIKNRFPSEVPLMNKYLYDMIHTFQDRHQNMDEQETILR